MQACSHQRELNIIITLNLVSQLHTICKRCNQCNIVPYKVCVSVSMYKCVYVHAHAYTVEMERFPGLNLLQFQPH